MSFFLISTSSYIFVDCLHIPANTYAVCKFIVLLITISNLSASALNTNTVMTSGTRQETVFACMYSLSGCVCAFVTARTAESEREWVITQTKLAYSAIVSDANFPTLKNRRFSIDITRLSSIFLRKLNNTFPTVLAAWEKLAHCVESIGL